MCVMTSPLRTMYSVIFAWSLIGTPLRRGRLWFRFRIGICRRPRRRHADRGNPEFIRLTRFPHPSLARLALFREALLKQRLGIVALRGIDLPVTGEIDTRRRCGLVCGERGRGCRKKQPRADMRTDSEPGLHPNPALRSAVAARSRRSNRDLPYLNRCRLNVQ